MVVGGCSKALQATATATATPPPASAAFCNISDIEVIEHLKTALQRNDTLKGFDINVVTLKGDVRLIGVLNNQA